MSKIYPDYTRRDMLTSRNVHYVIKEHRLTLMSLQSALEKLASFRRNNTRESQETFERGIVVLKSGKTTKLGDDGEETNPYFLHTSPIYLFFPLGWAFLEQLCLASIDIGRLDVANVCQTFELEKCAP